MSHIDTTQLRQLMSGIHGLTIASDDPRISKSFYLMSQNAKEPNDA